MEDQIIWSKKGNVSDCCYFAAIFVMISPPEHLSTCIVFVAVSNLLFHGIRKNGHWLKVIIFVKGIS